MESGLREGRLRHRDRGPPAARCDRLGSRGCQLQHVPLDHRGRELRHGAVAGESADRSDPRRRYHFRRRLPAVLADGIRNLHAAERGAAHRRRGSPRPSTRPLLRLLLSLRRPRPRDGGGSHGAGGQRRGGPVGCQQGEARSSGTQARGDARGWAHAWPAAQLQGERPEVAGRHQRRDEDSRDRREHERDGLHPGEHRAEGEDPGRLLHCQARSLRPVGDRVWLQADRRWQPRSRASGTGEDRHPQRRAGTGLRHRRGDRVWRSRPAVEPIRPGERPA